jgi:DnaJ-like protein
MGHLASSRRAALEGLLRILDTSAPEELFVGPEDDAAFLYGLLADVARARSSSYYWEICRTARRRGVTPEYVIDRAVVLLATIEERRRTDLYRILGVPGLASGDMIRQRWIEVAKRHHPDVGGDGAAFRRAKEAYEVLRDPMRRADYERFWLRALGPFERVAAGDDVPRLDVRPRPPVPVATHEPEVAAAPDTAGMLGVTDVFRRVEALLAPLPRAEIDTARAEVARTIERLEQLSAELATLARLKQALARTA